MCSASLEFTVFKVHRASPNPRIHTMLSQQRMGKSTREQNGQVSVFNSVHEQTLWARRFSHYMSDHFCQQEDVDRGKGPRQAPRPGQTRTPKAPRGPPLGAHAAEPGHPRLGAEPHFVAACLVCAEMVPFSYLSGISRYERHLGLSGCPHLHQHVVDPGHAMGRSNILLPVPLVQEGTALGLPFFPRQSLARFDDGTDDLQTWGAA